MGITFWKPGEEVGERAHATATYTLPDGSRIRIKAGAVIPDGAIPDPVPGVVHERAKPKPQNRAKKAAPENRAENR